MQKNQRHEMGVCCDLAFGLQPGPAIHKRVVNLTKRDRMFTDKRAYKFTTEFTQTPGGALSPFT
jgi:hypothetical protein